MVSLAKSEPELVGESFPIMSSGKAVFSGLPFEDLVGTAPG